MKTDRCPICGGMDIFSFTQKQCKCRKCKEQWTADLQPVDMPTEEEIEKVFPIKDCPVTQRDIDENNDSYWCQQGAKWYKNEIGRRNK